MREVIILLILLISSTGFVTSGVITSDTFVTEDVIVPETHQVTIESIDEAVHNRVLLNTDNSSYRGKWIVNQPKNLTMEIWSTGINVSIIHHSQSNERIIDTGLIRSIEMYNISLRRSDYIDITFSLFEDTVKSQIVFIFNTQNFRPQIGIPVDTIATNRHIKTLEFRTNTLQYSVLLNSSSIPINYYQPYVRSDLDTVYNLTVISDKDYHITDTVIIEFDFTTPDIVLNLPEASFIDTEQIVNIETSERLRHGFIYFGDTKVSEMIGSSISIYPYFIEPGIRQIEFVFEDMAGNVEIIEYTNFFNNTDYVRPYSDSDVEYKDPLSLIWKGIYKNITSFTLLIDGTEYSTGTIASTLEFNLNELTRSIDNFEIEFVAYSDYLIITNTFVIKVNDTEAPQILSVRFNPDISRDQTLDFTITDRSNTVVIVWYNENTLFEYSATNDTSSYSIPIHGWLNLHYQVKIEVHDSYNTNEHMISGVWDDLQPPIWINTPVDQVFSQSDGGELIEWEFTDLEIINTTLWINDTLQSFSSGNISEYQFQLSRLPPANYDIQLQVEDIGGNIISHSVLISVVEFIARTDLYEDDTDKGIILPAILITLMIIINIKPTLRRVIE